ncbi:N-acetylmuramoyl-L-alanine amidase family protein [Sebaldella sp. S0638]|uniref:peptidoglycan recognition protein family protein n=1 Tax=Sebaldella sp. S0638 TaxID=2957809 RepID=UPI00209FBBEB|nr:N-acetylmuramoyl-L-alanine amidase [Sebaldella sp. S0638]MCP1226351.1 N-acetylmuramoyl-L-alanine amidase [Sebaldella sp. S0638]
MKYNEVKKEHIPINAKKRPGKKLSAYNWITVHNTGNPSSSAKNERGWLTNPENTRSASWHIVVDGKEAIEAIPLDEIAYHAGTSEGNSTSIGIEVCDSAGEAGEKKAIELIASLLIAKGWGTEKVRTHKSWSGKDCPHIILKHWEQFIKDIEKEIQKQKGVSGQLDNKIYLVQNGKNIGEISEIKLY